MSTTVSSEIIILLIYLTFTIVYVVSNVFSYESNVAIVYIIKSVYILTSLRLLINLIIIAYLKN